MLIYVGFDDTDTIDADRGTGKLARLFEDRLPGTCRLRGVIRQQLPAIEGIPFTSRNSSACVIVETEEASMVETLVERAVRHIAEHFIDGSDPGLCVASDDSPSIPALVAFGLSCCRGIVTQEKAYRAARGVHLSGHGGTNDGIIGAAAAVGLTRYGWSGRFIEYGRLRDFPGIVSAGELERNGILVLPVDRDAMVPSPEDRVDTGGWLRPRLWAHRPVLPVELCSPGRWRVRGSRDSDKSGASEENSG